ncbi:hypothetical protein H632_c449p0, partial [Helicosporidium sp. ATCC 50920]
RIVCARSASVAIELTDVVRRPVPTESLEGIGVPMNTYSMKKPFKARVMSVDKLVGPRATGETYHVVIETRGEIPFAEGQSYGVVPPGSRLNSRGKTVPHATRLYSIASTRYGDRFDGRTASFCIRRATFWDPELGREDPEKKGICSNFLCDAAPGTEIDLSGPTGKLLLMPDDPHADVITVATGTGIAPFRAFWRRRFFEAVPSEQGGRGHMWLFMGVANSDAKLYASEIEAVEQAHPTRFRVDYALSREQTNASGGKMYVQDRLEQHADEVFDRLSAGAHIYFCGLKGMLPGILETLERVAGEKGIDWPAFLEGLKKEHRWHVEVY